MACIALSRAGCTLLAAHCHDQRPVIVVDRRPAALTLQPGTLRLDAHSADYHAAFGPVQIAWTEPRRGAA
ncbi:MAG: hypothetical protein JZU52_12590 [Lamprocystis purpurea]|nr:hypothetical protein [Lamprocystis purpurea]